MYKAFFNNGGWYVAWQDETGSHYQQDGKQSEREAKLEAREANREHEADLVSREASFN